MILYIGAIFLLLLVGLFTNSKNKEKNNFFLIISFLVMFFVMGFREISVGTDTSLYCSIFKNYGTMPFNYIFTNNITSFIYALYNKIVYMINPSVYSIIISNSFIICFLTILFIKNNSKRPVFSVLLFFTFYHFFSAMNISRQYIAVLIIANAFYYLKNRNVIKYIILCLIAIFIHNTAIVSLALLPFFYIKLNKRNILIYMFILSIGLFFANNIIYIFSSVFTHYDMYLSNDSLMEIGQNRKIIITLIYIVFSLTLSNLLKNKDIKKDETKYNELYLLHIINLIAIIIGIISLRSMLLSRIEIYFSIFAIILIPKVFDMMKDRVLYYFAFSIIMFVPMFLQLQSNHSEVLPYINWLFQ